MNKADHEAFDKRQMQALRVQLIELINDHELEHHHDQTFPSERIKLLAYLAHCMGVKAGMVHHVAEMIRVYEAVCPDCSTERN